MPDNELPPSSIADADEGRKIDWPIVTTRVPPDVIDLIDAKAKEAGQKRGEWARDVLVAAATT